MDKTFETLKKGDKILMEGVICRVPCYEVINGTTYLTKLETKDIEVVVIDNPPADPELTEEEKKNRVHAIFVDTFGMIGIPYVYVKSNICPNVKNGATAKII